MPNLLGTAPNQVPTNADLGKLAFMDVVDTVTNNPYLDTAISDTKPSLLLDFANSKTLDPRITYTRASTASYYDGKTTAVAEQNLLTYSQDLTQSVWAKSNITINTDSVVAPDGTTSTTSAVNMNAGTAQKWVAYNYAVGSGYTLSFYVKNGTLSSNYVQVAFGGNTGAYANINLNDGSLGTNSVSATVTSVGNGWYRVVVPNVSLPNGAFYVDAIDSGTATWVPSTSATGLFYLWGVQLEQRSVASGYTKTTSSPITNYIPALQTAAAGVPRFDHDPVTGESKGFLIEEQRSNLLTYSQDFSNGWDKNNAIVMSYNSIVAPDGTLTGCGANTTLATTRPMFSKVYPASAGESFSVYAKAGTANIIYVDLNTSGTCYAVFNLSTGNVVGSTGNTSTILPVGNGWYRCVLANTTVSMSHVIIGVRENYTSGDPYSNETGTGKGIYIWGAQLEAGSFATSYIPTTSAQVTRSADAASMTGANFSGWYNQAEGTVYADFTAIRNVSGVYVTPWLVGNASEGLNNNYIGLNWGGSGVGYAQVYGSSSGNASLLLPSLPTTLTQFKNAFAWKSFDAATSTNNASVLSKTSANIPPSINALFIHGNGLPGSTSPINGTIKKLAYYPKRLSDAELQEMTL